LACGARPAWRSATAAILRCCGGSACTANFAEYAPLALLLMALAELQHLPDWMIHALGILLLVGRATHAYGVGREPELFRARVLGMALTFAALGAGAVANLGGELLAPLFGGS
jgi:uncharacterized membrane protein YecN with MAPEG domain